MDLSNVFNMGGMVTGIGLTIVFSCLIALIIIMVLLPKIVNRKSTKKVPKKPVREAEKVTVKHGVAERATLPKHEDYELVAVLSAAVAAMMDTHPGNIVVRSYKRMGSSSWRKAGRDHQIFHKF